MERLSFYLVIAIAFYIGSVNAAEKKPKKDVVDWTKKDWDELVAGTKTCTATKFRPMADPAYPSKCPDGYTDDDGALLCYEECPAGWTFDGLNMCYEDCKPGWKEILGVCWSDTWKVMPQGSKGRGAGVIPNSCGAGKVKEGLLCYDSCPSGWKPFGCHCWKGLQSRGRGCGTAPRDCPTSHPLKQSGLCYKACPAGYPIAEGPVCWESCQNTHGPDAIDTGAFCESGEIKSYLQERYLRKSKMKECANGELDGLNCYEKCDDGYSGSPGVCWNDNLDNSIAAVVLSAGQLPLIQTCYTYLVPYAVYIQAQDWAGMDGADLDPFLKCAWPLLQTMDALDDSWDSSSGVTVAVVGKVKAKVPVVGVAAYGGLAFEFKDENNVDVWGFAGGCGLLHGKVGEIKEDHLHLKWQIGLSGGMAIFRSVNDIRGAKTYLSMGVNIFGILDAGSSWAFDDKCQVKGMTNTVGVSCGHIPCINAVPVTPDISTGVCVNFDTKLLGSVSAYKETAPEDSAELCDTNTLTDGAWFSPLDLPGHPRTVDTAEGCRQRCEDVAECYYFNNFPNGGCHLSGKNAQVDYSKKGSNPTRASGKVRCESDNSATRCDTNTLTDGAWFSPLDLPGHPRTVETAEECRQRCEDVAECYYFNNFPNGGCHLSGKNAQVDYSKKGSNPTRASGKVRCESASAAAVSGLVQREDSGQLPALIALHSAHAATDHLDRVSDGNYCCQARTVDGWNGNWNGVCWGEQTESDCNRNGQKCEWTPDDCRSELDCLLLDNECEFDEDCCSGRCKVDEKLCR